MNTHIINAPVDFNTIKQSVPMEWLLDHYGLTSQLRRSRDGFRGPCPIHGGTNPTQFSVSLTRNCWVCFGDCGNGGTVLDLVSRMEKVSLPEAARLLQQWFSVPASCTGRSDPPEPVHKSEVKAQLDDNAPNPPLWFALSDLDAAHPYLALRGLTPETIATFGVGYCAKGIMAGRIAIPIHNATGQLVAYAGRWPDKPPADKPKYLFPRGLHKSLELFNYHRAIVAEPSGVLVVVEGFFDCLKVWQAGCERVVAIMGSSLSAAQADLIGAAVGPGGAALLMFDEDGAGRAGREKAAARLAHRVHVNIVDLEVEGAQPDYLPADEIMALLGDTVRPVTRQNRPLNHLE